MSVFWQPTNKPGANVFGQGNGTAKGGAPHARIAAYKVCWPDLDGGGGCVDSDVLAAMDEAIYDGVDILTLSLGSDPPLPPFFQNTIAVGAFHAYKKGIPTVCSAGNAGPTPATVSNVAPWIITVGASSLDRSFTSDAILVNNKIYHVRFLVLSFSSSAPNCLFINNFLLVLVFC